MEVRITNFGMQNIRMCCWVVIIFSTGLGKRNKWSAIKCVSVYMYVFSISACDVSVRSLRLCTGSESTSGRLHGTLDSSTGIVYNTAIKWNKIPTGVRVRRQCEEQRSFLPLWTRQASHHILHALTYAGRRTLVSLFQVSLWSNTQQEKHYWRIHPITQSHSQ